MLVKALLIGACLAAMPLAVNAQTDDASPSIPPTIPPPGKDKLPDNVSSVTLSGMYGGYVRSTTYQRSSTQNGSAFDVGPWMLRTDSVVKARPGCKPENLDTCMLPPEK